ncbi:MAG: DUF4105 domain-containing protein, partial [Muribaculaceae bacterium]|nr:DUF4105 domain-containing protein [Muribaculaceae bacterium]
MTRFSFILFALAILIGVIPASGAESSNVPARVSVLTTSPGRDVYQLEGHATLRVITPAMGDMSIDWGVFDFNSPNFIYRFVSGQTDYTTGVYPTELHIAQASRQGRRITERVINLDSIQTERLLDLLDEQLKPWNRVYRYNYVKDNCSTRIYRLLEQAIGDTITFDTIPSTMYAHGRYPTFRRLMDFHHRNYPWYQFGIDLALGSGIDYPLSNRETLYAPTILDFQLEQATVNGQPLVIETNTLVEGAPGAIDPPTPFVASPLFVTLLVMLLTIIVTWVDLKRDKTSRWLDTLLYSIFGVMGLVLTFLIFVSVHEATSPNWLYLWVNPLCFIGAIGIWLKKCKKLVVYWQMLNFALLIALTVIGLAGVQSINAAVYPLIITDLTRSMLYLYRYVKTI